MMIFNNNWLGELSHTPEVLRDLVWNSWRWITITGMNVLVLIQRRCTSDIHRSFLLFHLHTGGEEWEDQKFPWPDLYRSSIVEYKGTSLESVHDIDLTFSLTLYIITTRLSVLTDVC